MLAGLMMLAEELGARETCAGQMREAMEGWEATARVRPDPELVSDITERKEYIVEYIGPHP